MILVTGGTGLLGTYVVLKLAKENQNLKVLIRDENLKENILYIFKIYEPINYQELFNSIHWVKGDILDIYSLEPALESVTKIYHIAGKISFQEKDKKELYKVNVEGTRNLVNLSIEKNINKLCYISSIATLDPEIDQNVIYENSEWNFKTYHSSYACSKFAAEMEVWRGSQEGLNVIIICPGVILGSGNWNRSSGMLFDMAISNKVYSTKGLTGFVDAEDVANIIVKLMESDVINEKYIVVSENASYKQVFSILRRHINQSEPIVISNFLIKSLALLTKVLPTQKKLSRSVVNALINTTTYSNQKIISKINYKFKSLEDSLLFHFNNFIKHKNL